MLSPKLTALVARLQGISPMPDDDTLNEWPDEDVSPLETYDEIMTELEQETQVEYPFELVPYLLEVFGIDEGNGGFWRLLHLIEDYPNKHELYPFVQKATGSSNPGTRKWSCFLLARRQEKEDEPFFLARLQDEVAQVRYEALVGIIRLSQRYNMTHLIPIIEPLLQDEDYEVSDAAHDALKALKASADNDEKG